jgi:hypothetical protein
MFLIFLTLITFSLTGLGVKQVADTANVVATVGREKITLDEYLKTYDSARNQYKYIWGDKFDGFEKEVNLKTKILDSMIEEKLLLLGAKDIGMKVTDDELKEAITHEQAFTKDGKFDNQVYLGALRAVGMTPEGFEKAKRQDLTLIKMRRHIGESASLSDSEMKQMLEEKEKTAASRETLLEKKRGDAINAFVDDLKKRIEIKVNTELLSK